MSSPTLPANVTHALEQLEAAVQAEKVSAAARDNIVHWLSEPKYGRYVGDIVEHIETEQWQALDDAFWTIIPFGTGGRRGRMYAFGSNAINDRTIGESAQGLAEYVKEKRTSDGPLACAIAYDTRHRSRHFAELCAGIMVANGYHVYFLDDYRSTPELSFLVRQQDCDCGIMVTASHNPPSDNAVKVYWSTGGQILPPHDKAIIDRVMNVDEIVVSDFAEALAAGQVTICTAETDAAFVDVLKQQCLPGPRDIKIIYSPLHGVGSSAVLPVLAADGFADVELYAPHAEPNGDFPNVPGHVSNPENPEVFTAIIERAKEIGADVIMASDPDCDRMGCAAPLTFDSGSEWATLNGNQIGVLLTDYVLSKRTDLTPDHYIIKTLVTTEMIRRIADSYNVQTFGNLLVGFKWIGGVMDEQGPDKFVFGTEESHGYLVGQYARDKDGAIASALMAELAAELKGQGKTLHQRLTELFEQHGYHKEHLVSIYMEGSQGMARMEALMQKLRDEPPQELSGLKVAAIRDYLTKQRKSTDGTTTSFEGPTGNLLILELAEEGNYVAVRPSGTEPKVKLYMFTYVAPGAQSSLQASADCAQDRLTSLETALRAIADSV